MQLLWTFYVALECQAGYNERPTKQRSLISAVHTSGGDGDSVTESGSGDVE